MTDTAAPGMEVNVFFRYPSRVSVWAALRGAQSKEMKQSSAKP